MTDDHLRIQVRGILWKHFPKAVTRQIDAPTDEIMAVLGERDIVREQALKREIASPVDQMVCACGHIRYTHSIDGPCHISGCGCEEFT